MMRGDGVIAWRLGRRSCDILSRCTKCRMTWIIEVIEAKRRNGNDEEEINFVAWVSKLY